MKYVILRTIIGMWICSSLLLHVVDGSTTITARINGKTDPRSTRNRWRNDGFRDSVLDAMDLLLSLGLPEENLCTNDQETSHFLPTCGKDTGTEKNANRSTLDWNSVVRSRRQRYLQEEKESFADDEREGDLWFLLTHAFCALACVTIAALAAGLTLGLLSLDPLLLLIRMRAGSTEEEKEQAASLLPIVKQHHLLLVTLLLLNSIANEALPLFLEVLVPPLVAVILSVTLVLFGGEIIPAAIFTGPNKIKLASQMIPLVRFVMFVLWPIAYPIAKILDHVLHHDGEDGAFNRGELSALVRIQYEERLATKQQQKENLAKIRKSQRLEPTYNLVSQRRVSAAYYESMKTSESSAIFGGQVNSSKDNYMNSLHNDEIVMVEGALQMKTKCAMDVYTPLRHMYAVPITTELNEETVVDIYSSGFSRIPVYKTNPQKPKQKSSICGVLMTKQLIVVNPNDCRQLNTLPLYQPMCVSPKINLVDLLNIFQTGKSGHLALVCARPDIAESCLICGEAVPDRAGFMGVVTIEDVLEELLQEAIADEFDKKEWKNEKLSLWVIHKWKRFVTRRKKDRETAGQYPTFAGDATISDVSNEASERSALLGDQKAMQPKRTTGLL